MFDFVALNVNISNLTIGTVNTGASSGFNFVGTCSTVCDYQDTYHTCIHNENCEVQSSQIVLTLPYLIAGQKYLI